MRPQDIVYEIGNFTIVRVKHGRVNGFDIYENKVTHSERVAQCGYEGKKGLDWCRAEIDRRQQLIAPNRV